MMEFIPLQIREHREKVRVMPIFWISCALAMSRTPFAVMSHNQLQMAKNDSCVMNIIGNTDHGHVEVKMHMNNKHLYLINNTKLM